MVRPRVSEEIERPTYVSVIRVYTGNGYLNSQPKSIIEPLRGGSIDKIL